MIIIPQVQLGAGRHWQYIEPPENIVKGLHLNFVTQPLCLIGLCLTKVSVGLFLLRITPSKRFQYFIWGCIVFTVLSSTGNLRKFDVRSGPSFKLTDTVTSHGHASVQAPCFYLRCVSDKLIVNLDVSAILELKNAANFRWAAVLTDLTFALLPVPMLWQVQLNWKVKTAVAGVLSLGIL